MRGSIGYNGQMRTDGNYGATLGVEPNSYGEWQEQSAFKEPPLELSGAADHWNHREDDADTTKERIDISLPLDIKLHVLSIDQHVASKGKNIRSYLENVLTLTLAQIASEI